MPSFTCQAILFDLDGVLADSTPSATRIWGEWALKHGLDPAYVLHIAHGRPTIESVRVVAPQLDAAHEAAIIEQREIEDTAGLLVLPGVKDLLQSLPLNRYTIVTSGTRRLATARLKAAGLPVPQNMITADDVSHGKPDPEPYRKGAAAVGFPPAQCIVFEDAPSGIRAAQAAGATAIAVPTTYKPEELTAAALIIPSLAAVSVKVDVASGALQIHITDQVL